MSTIRQKVINTQGQAGAAYVRSVSRFAGNSLLTLAEFPGMPHLHAGLVPPPAFQPEKTFMLYERRSLTAKPNGFVPSSAHGLPHPTQNSIESPAPGTVSLFN